MQIFLYFPHQPSMKVLNNADRGDIKKRIELEKEKSLHANIDEEAQKSNDVSSKSIRTRQHRLSRRRCVQRIVSESDWENISTILLASFFARCGGMQAWDRRQEQLQQGSDEPEIRNQHNYACRRELGGDHMAHWWVARMDGWGVRREERRATYDGSRGAQRSSASQWAGPRACEFGTVPQALLWPCAVLLAPCLCQVWLVREEVVRRCCFSATPLPALVLRSHCSSCQQRRANP